MSKRAALEPGPAPGQRTPVLGAAQQPAEFLADDAEAAERDAARWAASAQAGGSGADHAGECEHLNMLAVCHAMRPMLLHGNEQKINNYIVIPANKWRVFPSCKCQVPSFAHLPVPTGPAGQRAAQQVPARARQCRQAPVCSVQVTQAGFPRSPLELRFDAGTCSTGSEGANGMHRGMCCSVVRIFERFAGRQTKTHVQEGEKKGCGPRTMQGFGNGPAVEQVTECTGWVVRRQLDLLPRRVEGAQQPC